MKYTVRCRPIDKPAKLNNSLGDKFVDLNCYFRQKAEIEGGRKFEVKGLISARSGSETGAIS
jgi:hypothetical protein